MNEPSGAGVCPTVVIGVDARTFQYTDSTSRGIGHYALHHLLATASLCPDWKFILFNDTGRPNPATERLLKFSHFSLHALDARPLPHIDLFHIPDPMNMSCGFDSPFRLFPDLKTTVIFHDLIPLRFYWNTWSEVNQQTYSLRLDQLRNGSAQILTNSEFTRLDLIKGTGIPRERTDVIMAGLNRSEKSGTEDPFLIQKVRREHGITKPFFLHVGALDPHKNFETVIKAFGQLAPAGSAQLVVVGQKENYMKLVADWAAKQKMKDLIFTGFIPRADLEALYAEAVALLFLSRYEGFGFPVLEAMSQGCPVITTSVTSIPEVAGDAALLFDPADVTGISQGMQKFLGSFTTRESFRQKGMVQAAKFTWEQSARKTIAVWEKMLGRMKDIPATQAQPIAERQPAAQLIETPQKTEAVEPADSDSSQSENPAQCKRGVVWFAPWQNNSGYCSEALAFAQGIAASVPLELVDVARDKSPSFVAGLPGHLRSILAERLQEKINPANKIAILHMPGSSLSYLPGVAWCIGRTMFETEQLPASWISNCNLMDEVWVPSQFNAETFAANGVEPSKLVVMPEAVDEKEFDPAPHTPLPLPNRAKFNFLSVFEWTSRKGWDVLLSAYLREFSAQDDVCLYLRTYLREQPEGDPVAVMERLVREHVASLNLGDKPLPRIQILSEHISRSDLPRLYKAVDCLVAPSRGEGWGRPHHEAMLMELPVIATNWSGNTEFMNAENSYLLDYELVEAKNIEAGLWHYRGHRWANPSENHLRQLMRLVVVNPTEAVEKGKAARRHMVENFSVAKVGEKVLARLREIEALLIKPSCPPSATRSNTIPNVLKAVTEPVQVAWEGSFLDFGSLSHVNRELTRQVAGQPEIQLRCIGKNTLPPGIPQMNALRQMTARLHAQPVRGTQVTVRHAWPPVWEAPAAGAWILIQPWEYGALPVEWVRQLANVDEAWVPSEYVRRVYVDSGVASGKVKVVPNGIDPEKFHPDCAPMQLPTRKTFKFLFVGGTIHRKGPDLLLEAYLKNFTAADDVCLVIKDFGGKSVYAGQTIEQQIKAAQAQPNGPEILHLTDELAPEALPGLYAACDCLVHPYRGEGFGLPVLEAMACGLPVVVTAGGSTDDFAGDDHAYRIPARRQSIGPEVSGMRLIRDGWLLEPDRDALAEKMKWVANHREDAHAKGRVASEYVRREWTWARAAEIAAERLQEVVARKQAVTNLQPQFRAIALPDAAKAGQLNGARELFAKKDFQSAWKQTLVALERRPFHCEAWMLLAEIAQSAGDFNQARTCIEKAQRLAPNWKPARQFAKSLGNKPGRSVAWAVLPELPATPRLTVCLITKNEERFLSQCLQSVRGLAHQIVVVDTGSTDRTVAIAQEHGAEVHHFAWCDDFSAARNAALEQATGDWILCLDADEELLPEHRQTILQEMQTASVMGWRLPIIDKGREGEGRSYVPRLFRNAPGLFFVGRIHEQVFSSLEVRCKEWGLENRLGKTTLLHHGYQQEVVASRGKVSRNLRLLQLAIEDLPGEPNLVMNLGLELIRSGQLEAGLAQYRDAFKLMSALPANQVVPELRETLLTQLAAHLLKAKLYTEIVQLAQTPLARSAGLTASQHFTLGLAHLELNQPAEAATHFRECLKKRSQPALSPVNPEILKAGPQHCLALALTALKDTAGAEQAFREALNEDASSRPVRWDFARFQFQRGESIEALKLLNQLVAENSKDTQAWQFGGQIALSQPGFLEFVLDWTAEGIKSLPEHPGIMIQRAEALLLGQKVDEALPLWRKAHAPNSARHLAALTLCELLTGDCKRRFAEGDERLVSQEFLKWYRQLIKAGATQLVGRIDEKLTELRAVLPTCADTLAAAFKQAREAVAA